MLWSRSSSVAILVQGSVAGAGCSALLPSLPQEKWSKAAALYDTGGRDRAVVSGKDEEQAEGEAAESESKPAWRRVATSGKKERFARRVRSVSTGAGAETLLS